MDKPPRTRLARAGRFTVRWTLFLVVLYGGIVFLAKWFENRLVFIPTRAEEHWEPPPSAEFQDVWLTSSDGTRHHAWYLPHPDPTAGTVLYSHGNGGNLSFRGPVMLKLRDHLGRSVLAYDYPGYGKSSGSPSEAGCYAAADAGYRWLTEERGIPAEKLILFGESLGCAVAIDVASRKPHQAMVLMYPFTTLPAAAKFHHPYLPCESLMTNRFDNLAKIGQCRTPLFLAHGTADVIVPFTQGEQLFAVANEPKQFFRIENGHHDIPMDDPFFQRIRQFLDAQ